MTVKKDAYATHCSKDQKVAAEKWHQLRNLVLTTSTATANDVMPLLVFTTRGRVPQRRCNERLLQTYAAMREFWPFCCWSVCSLARKQTIKAGNTARRVRSVVHSRRIIVADPNPVVSNSDIVDQASSLNLARCATHNANRSNDCR